MKKVIVHQGAEVELWQAVDYYELKRTGLGLELEKEIRRGLARIQSAPNNWPRKNYDTRCYLLKRFPYAIYYLDLSDTIWIVAFAHQKRRPYYWRKRVN